MNILGNINFYDFSFNGKKLSEFGGIIGGSDPLNSYSLLPSRAYVTDRAIGQDGTTVFESYLEPRTFEVPVFFENIDDGGIRKIASWLNVPEPTWFSFDGDDIRIKCCLDSNGTALETLAGMDGQAVLKFIAHDPYYYEMTPTVNEYTSLSGDSFSYTFQNKGQSVSYPRIELYGSGEFTVTITDLEDTELSECTLSNITSGVIVDSASGDVLSASGASNYNNFDGVFPYIPANSGYKILVSGQALRIKISHNYRWI